MATRSDWLHRIPPWRAPRRHHRHHDLDIIPLIGMCILAMLLLEVWAIEFSLWVTVWIYYGAFLGARQLYRANPIGRAASTPVARPAVAVDPNPTPIDLAQWDGPTRRRS